jgi:hypothetical protein
MDRFDFTTTVPATERADGSATPGNSFDHLELVRRDAGWVAVAAGGAGGGLVTLHGLESGVGIYAFRAVDPRGRSSLTSNVVITGSTSVASAGVPLGPDPDEPNGKPTPVEGTALAVPAFHHAASLWPAGDEDDYWLSAPPGDVVTLSAVPTAIDFRNDLDLVVDVLDDSHHLLATGSSPAPGEAVHLTVAMAPRGDSTHPRRISVRIVDRSGSRLDPSGAPRVLIPPTYELSVDVEAPDAPHRCGPSTALASRIANADDFSFVNTGSNPVRGRATFGFAIPRRSRSESVMLRVYDVRGRLVTTLVNGTRAAGAHLASWSGCDSRGNRVAFGPYFARLDAGSWSRVIRIDLAH